MSAPPKIVVFAVVLYSAALWPAAFADQTKKPLPSSPVLGPPALRGGASQRRRGRGIRPTLSAACAKIASDHVRGILFGGLDGILTTFAIMAASSGAGQRPSTTCVLGLSTLLADAFSMGGGEYLSAKAEAATPASQGSSSSRGSLASMEPTPLAKGVAMFVAFFLFGSVPLFGFVVSHIVLASIGPTHQDYVSVFITTAALFALGALKSQFSTGVWWRAGLEVVSVGGIAAAVAYGTAALAETVVERMNYAEWM